MEKFCAGLFDLDGVILDTETQYTEFWAEQGELLPAGIKDFGRFVKGRTLKEILENYFPDPEQQRQIVRKIEILEQKMKFDFIPGVMEFVEDLKRNGIKIAIVTSSDDSKMRNVFRVHPEFRTVFDSIVTADKIKRSKPDPECYLLAAGELNAAPGRCVVFEDSFSGLQAGKSAGMFVVGLATTNPEKDIVDKADIVIPDFKGYTCAELVAARENI